MEDGKDQVNCFMYFSFANETVDARINGLRIVDAGMGEYGPEGTDLRKKEKN